MSEEPGLEDQLAEILSPRNEGERRRRILFMITENVKLEERVKLLESKLDAYDSLTSRTGRLLIDTGVLIEEHGGDLDDLREIVAKHKLIGLAMIRATELGWRNDPNLKETKEP